MPWQAPMARLEAQAHRLVVWVAVLTVLSAIAAVIGYIEHNDRQVIARHACQTAKQIAVIERKLVDRQEAQTEALLAKGVSFGLSAQQLAAAREAGKATMAQFLAELDELATTNC